MNRYSEFDGCYDAYDMRAKNNMQVNPINNNNFNKCGYIQNVSPNNLYEPYAGFIRGNMFPDLYNQYKVSRPFDVEPINEQAQLLTYLDSLAFSAHDLNLYLDTHPNDRNMIQRYNEYRQEKEKVLKEYESKYGPLLVTSDATMTYPWAWNQLPWPWENK